MCKLLPWKEPQYKSVGQVTDRTTVQDMWVCKSNTPSDQSDLTINQSLVKLLFYNSRYRNNSNNYENQLMSSHAQNEYKDTLPGLSLSAFDKKVTTANSYTGVSISV